MSDKTLLVIDPAVEVSADALADLANAGYIVLRCMPEDINIIGKIPSDPLVLSAALDSIRDYHDQTATAGNGVRSLFGRRLAAALGYEEVVKLK